MMRGGSVRGQGKGNRCTEDEAVGHAGDERQDQSSDGRTWATGQLHTSGKGAHLGPVPTEQQG